MKVKILVERHNMPHFQAKKTYLVPLSSNQDWEFCFLWKNPIKSCLSNRVWWTSEFCDFLLDLPNFGGWDFLVVITLFGHEMGCKRIFTFLDACPSEISPLYTISLTLYAFKWEKLQKRSTTDCFHSSLIVRFCQEWFVLANLIGQRWKSLLTTLLIDRNLIVGANLPILTDS